MPDAGGDSATVVALAAAGPGAGPPAPSAGTPDVGASGGATAAAEPGAPARLLWSWSVLAGPGPVTADGDVVVAAVSATGKVLIDGADVPVRGAPGVVLVGLDAAGHTAWTRALGSTEWASAGALSALPGGDVVVAGSFAGTLRLGDQVVSSAGSSDGFVARLGPDGAVRWLIRVGGHGADRVAGAAALGDRVAVAGTFSGEADFRGHALAPIEEHSGLPDGFVAVLDRAGQVAWVRRFGSAAEDEVAGVAVTGSGRIAVAGTVRAVTWLGAGGATLTAGGVEDWDGHGIADGLVALWDDRGEVVGSALVGGRDYDGLRAIAARGDEVVVGGWFSGTMDVGGTHLVAGGGDDGFVAILDGKAHLVRATALTGDGREDVSALGAGPAGWAAGANFTAAATFGDARFPAPIDPGGGCAIVFRPR